MTGTVAVLTPPGVAAIAVVRLAGPLNAAFAAAHLSRPPRPGKCVHCDLVDGKIVLDDVLAVMVDAHRLDLNLHGGAYVVQATLRLLTRFGYAVTDWADAPEMVFDPADPIAGQIARDLPQAKSIETLRLLTAQPAAWREMIVSADRVAATQALADVTLERMLATPTVAIVGPANVGKSTLANALFGRERSITADLPGTTRDWVGDEADLDGLVVRLVDTPGERATDDPIEAAAQRAARPVVVAADLVVVAVDGSTPTPAEARELLARYPAALVVRTKADRPRNATVERAIDVAAIDGTGLNALRAAVRGRLGCEDVVSPHARCWTPDQRAALGRFLNAGEPLAVFLASPGVYNRGASAAAAGGA